jgi:hypothetical protein
MEIKIKSKQCFLALGMGCILTRTWSEMQGKNQVSICFPGGRAVFISEVAKKCLQDLQGSEL